MKPGPLTRIFIFAALILAAPVAARASDGVHAGSIMVMTDDASVSDSALRGLAAEADGQYRAIRTLLGGLDSGEIRIVVGDTDISRSFSHSRRIETGAAHLRNGQVPIAHELTHILAYGASSLVLSEGFAIYIQDRVGKGRVFPNYGRDLNDLMAELSRRWNIPIPKEPYAFATASIPDVDRMRQRTLAYLFAGSFARFLVEDVLRGDISRFMALYRSGDYQKFTGQSLSGLEDKWRASTGL